MQWLQKLYIIFFIYIYTFFFYQLYQHHLFFHIHRICMNLQHLLLEMISHLH